MHNQALVLLDVSKSFGPIRAVDHLSLEVPAGTIYGFIGPNGAGKTTTIRMIMNIIYPDTGRIEIMGNANADVRSLIGYMPEERGLYRKMTIRAVLNFIGSIKGMRRAELAREIPRWLERVGLSDRANRRVEELSRGMQQKMQFVATVINNPPLLILDEPFSGLDPVNLDLIKGIMTEMRAQGKTVIYSTHMMEHAERLCDYILLINRGEKVINGTMREIRSRFPSDTVRLEIEGDASFLESLPIVKNVLPDGQRFEVALTDEADPQDLLRAVVERVRVRAFEVKVPSLHEIFVELVGSHHA